MLFIHIHWLNPIPVFFLDVSKHRTEILTSNYNVWNIYGINMVSINVLQECSTQWRFTQGSWYLRKCPENEKQRKSRLSKVCVVNIFLPPLSLRLPRNLTYIRDSTPESSWCITNKYWNILPQNTRRLNPLKKPGSGDKGLRWQNCHSFTTKCFRGNRNYDNLNCKCPIIR